MMTRIKRSFYEDLKREDFKIGEDYSGRGMYGKMCLALRGKITDLAWFVSYVTNWIGDEDYNWVFEDVHMDSMGRDMVFYWPGVQVAKEDEEDG